MWHITVSRGTVEVEEEPVGLHEAHGEENDLGDHHIVRHHHGHRPEEHLQVVWQLPPASVPREWTVV